MFNDLYYQVWNMNHFALLLNVLKFSASSCSHAYIIRIQHHPLVVWTGCALHRALGQLRRRQSDVGSVPAPVPARTTLLLEQCPVQ